MFKTSKYYKSLCITVNFVVFDNKILCVKVQAIEGLLIIIFISISPHIQFYLTFILKNRIIDFVPTVLRA